ncbi:hypothetical protein EGT36_19970 [Agrobacterium sp. FDAARGOS_525]|uniref:hypothetical protein n=1 Tax=Agrobacterium sp. FDAARGOS_525 TaxID=2420311 RepID=UPI000F6923BA|nr:hypothetical protein [Agrobacterium sp. FDAARGOS_525]RSC30985.1 hypothetical protein EGT36_19970 [Agrobacterium sp. FDAARGOS_525]
MRFSVTIFRRPLTIETVSLSYLYIETDGHVFAYDRHEWFKLPSGAYRHWLLEKKRQYQPPMSETQPVI